MDDVQLLLIMSATNCGIVAIIRYSVHTLFGDSNAFADGVR
ncbi:MAG TPA: hypothetical protein PKM88_13900 [bacterium]|nr:hypothetical protein [bacterium]